MKQNNYSIGYKKYLNKQKRNKVIIICTQIGLFIYAVVFWELMARLKIVDTFITSSPSRILE